MPDIIHLLPDRVANQIAAGEVIQRPSNVIKELVENSVDAGATEIKIIVKDAGRTLLQVIDNGKGMTETDARMAFERHSTSKIAEAEDLLSLCTMGFRGEALPSICSIAQIEMTTRAKDQRLGTKLVINGSIVESQEPCVSEQGTNIKVKNIFYNFPARRKFLKSDTVELTNIMREFERLALVNNHIRMSIDTGTRVLDLPAGSFHQRIQDLWKNNLNMQLLPVAIETDLIKIEGYVCRPENARRRNPLQYLIVNGRNMRHPYFHRAIMQCYEGLIAQDAQPCYFLKFNVDPATIDVNVHPTKNEIKFEYEQEIWRILSASVKAALGKFSAVPSIDFTADVLDVPPLMPGQTAHQPSLRTDPSYNPFRSSQERNRHVGDWEKLMSQFEKASVQQPSQQQTEELPLAEPSVDIPVCIQFASKYIITTTSLGLLAIDQHRAHVKVLYEQYLAKARKMELVGQSVLFPAIIELSEEHQSALESVGAAIEKMGFKLEYLDSNRWQITSVPSLHESIDAKETILKILDSICNDMPQESVSDDVVSRIALMMARAGAIERGRQLSVSEMEHLISRLFSLPDPKYTPNGNPIFAVIDEQLIQTLF